MKIVSSMVVAAASLIAGFTSNAIAQPYPNRTITFIWPFNVGTANGEAFRVLAEETGKILGRPMVTEFRGGASGRLGLQALGKAPPDGYLISAGLGAMFTVIPMASSSFKIEVGRDYTPIMVAAEAYSLITSHPSLPFRDLKGLVAYAKANPGKLKYGSPGVGNDSHLQMEQIQAATGIELLHIPYKGSAAALPDRLSGAVDLYLSGVDAVTFVDAGKLVGIATTGPRRPALAPNIPTLVEQGLPGMVLGTWVGLSAAGGTPPDIISRLNVAFNQAFKNPSVLKAMDAGGWTVKPSTSEAMVARIKSDYEIYAPIVKKLKLNFD